MLCKVNGEIFDRRKMIYRSLGFGSDPGLPLLEFEIHISPFEAKERFEVSIDSFIEQCRIDDLGSTEILVPEVSELNYPDTDRLLLEHPKLLSELIVDYLHFEILDSLFLESPQDMWQFAVNSVDSVDVLPERVIILGKGYFF